jgi:hypothetical protein
MITPTYVGSGDASKHRRLYRPELRQAYWSTQDHEPSQTREYGVCRRA